MCLVLVLFCSVWLGDGVCIVHCAGYEADHHTHPVFVFVFVSRGLELLLDPIARRGAAKRGGPLPPRQFESSSWQLGTARDEDSQNAVAKVSDEALGYLKII